MKNLLIISVLTTILFSCKKSNSSSSTGTTVKYEITTTGNNGIGGQYYTAAGYDLGFLANNTKDWTLSIAVSKPFSSHLEYLAAPGDTATLTISVNNNVAKTQMFINTTNSPDDIYYTVN